MQQGMYTGYYPPFGLMYSQPTAASAWPASSYSSLAGALGPISAQTQPNSNSPNAPRQQNSPTMATHQPSHLQHQHYQQQPDQSVIECVHIFLVNNPELTMFSIAAPLLPQRRSPLLSILPPQCQSTLAAHHPNTLISTQMLIPPTSISIKPPSPRPCSSIPLITNRICPSSSLSSRRKCKRSISNVFSRRPRR